MRPLCAIRRARRRAGVLGRNHNRDEPEAGGAREGLAHDLDGLRPRGREHRCGGRARVPAREPEHPGQAREVQRDYCAADSSRGAAPCGAGYGAGGRGGGEDSIGPSDRGCIHANANVGATIKDQGSIHVLLW